MPHVTRAQIREVDRRAIEVYGIPGVVLMENAGRGATEIILARWSDPAETLAIPCGGGNNGGDGFVIARHAVNTGRAATIILCRDPDTLTGDAAVHYRIARCMGIPMVGLDELDAALADARIVVDAMLGTGFSGRVRSPLDAAIDSINAHDGVTVAIDVPSGLDCDTGQAEGPAIRADLTITFVAPKIGFAVPGAAELTGEVVVTGIGAPHNLIEECIEENE